MGTNFYFHYAEHEPLHIGKSSVGWVFALHVYPDDGINDLGDWLRFLDTQDGRILDEYDSAVPVPDMVVIITKRGRDDGEKQWQKSPYGYSSWDNFHYLNHSIPGPRGLLRSKVESRGSHRQSFTNGCVKNGEGTWDCMVGEFS